MRVTFRLTKISDVVKHAMNMLFTVWNDEKGEGDKYLSFGKS
jgi:hypothetical protein